jgi:hypothetical protein
MPVEQLNVETLSSTTDLVGAAVHGSTVTTLHDRHHATNRRSSAPYSVLSEFDEPRPGVAGSPLACDHPLPSVGGARR